MSSQEIKTYFQSRSTPVIARDLLGCRLTYIHDHQTLGGIIVETEAYLGVQDTACYSFHGHRSAANEGLYREGGTLFIYAQRQYFFLNIATQPAEHPEGILIRALEPTDGLDQMSQNRGGKTGRLLTNGPAKIMQAFGIHDRKWRFSFLTDSPFRIDLAHPKKASHIIAAPRIGIRKVDSYWDNYPLRFYVDGNPYVSDMKVKKIRFDHGWG